MTIGRGAAPKAAASVIGEARDYRFGFALLWPDDVE
jgi:hypothetical protein